MSAWFIVYSPQSHRRAILADDAGVTAPSPPKPVPHLWRSCCISVVARRAQSPEGRPRLGAGPATRPRRRVGAGSDPLHLLAELRRVHLVHPAPRALEAAVP